MPKSKDKSQKAPEVIDPSAIDNGHDTGDSSTTKTTASNPAPQSTATPVVGVDKSSGNVIVQTLHWIGSHKKISIPLITILILAILAVLPVTRYAVAGTFWHENYVVNVVDTQTHQPVSNAQITLGGIRQLTDAHGRVILHVRIGYATLAVSKKYYRSTSQKVLVPLHDNNTISIKLIATGRQIPVTITNRINGKPVANAVVAAAGTKITTNTKGQATIVLPAEKSSAVATITATTYNQLTATIQISSQAGSKNSFQMVPAGKVYFLSNLSGNLDVVKTNLDGSDRQTVLAGTGQEDPRNTVFTASSDWKYIALLAKRDSGLPKLYLIDTTNNDKLTTVDEGNANFDLAGWYGDSLIYTVTRLGLQPWQTHAQALKLYNAATGQLKTIDQTTAESKGNNQNYDGYNFGQVYTLNNEIVYTKDWYANGTGVNAGSYSAAVLMSFKPDGTGLKKIKSFPIPAYGYSGSPNNPFYGYDGYNLYEVLASPDDLYVETSVTDYPAPAPIYYEYHNGQIQQVTDTQDAAADFDKGYPSYVISPSGAHSFWDEQRDGKQTLFIGDASGDNSQQIASLSDYEAYGWYTDNYLLVSKGSNELYVMPRTGGKALKVTDYYNPQDVLGIYGRGYGGR